ncbi:MAG: hypothetical protein JXQ96_23815 [Cyclobacteriaceae bacterium]
MNPLFKIFLITVSSLVISKSTTYAQLDSLSITITANNLSEDMNVLSTKNDEILLLGYTQKDVLGKPLFIEKLLFDESHKKHETKLSLDCNCQIILFMIELDSKKTIEQIDPVLRVHHQQIVELYSRNEWVKLQTYLGDEDMLGTKKFETPIETSGVSFEFEGIQKIEKYSYSIEINQR